MQLLVKTGTQYALIENKLNIVSSPMAYHMDARTTTTVAVPARVIP